MDTKINLRIDECIKDSLEEQAIVEGISLSEYIRRILTDHIGLELDDEFFELQENQASKVMILSYSYEKTFDFTNLLTWIFCKYLYPIDTNSKEVITALKQKVELVISESTFSQDLKMEFVKIFNDINRFLGEPDYTNKQFYFPIPNLQSSFNFTMLMNEIWSKK